MSSASENHKLSERLKRARVQAGFKTLEAAASAAGLPRSTLKSYETGRSRPPADKLLHLSRFYDKSVEWLLGESDQESLLPPGMILVDRGLVDKLLGTTEEADLSLFLLQDPPIVPCMTQIPERTEIVEVEEALRIKDRILIHLQTHAPKVLERWMKKFSRAAEGAPQTIQGQEDSP